MENDRRVGEHQKDKESFMEQIKMFKDMFDTLKEDHTDTKELLKEVHQVMGKFADVSLLGSQTPSSNREFVRKRMKPSTHAGTTLLTLKVIPQSMQLLLKNRSSRRREPKNPRNKGVRKASRRSLWQKLQNQNERPRRNRNSLSGTKHQL